MSKKPVIFFALVSTLLLTSACASNTERFYWGNYENALYIYAKKPDHGPAYEKALDEAITTGRKRNQVAPGLLAELGYMRLEAGDSNSAIKLFDEEMSLFPESKAFLSSVVLRAKSQSKTQASDTPQVSASPEESASK